jgi:hypothetical protein
MDTYYCQCTNCRQMVTITSTAAWHSATGCISCDPEVDADGFYSEPENFWAAKRARA